LVDLRQTSNAMTTQRTANGLPNGRNGFRGEGELETSSSKEADAGVNGISNGTGTLKLNSRRKVDRKKSSPMLPAFMVSAPGKVILCGEHGVVHGKVSLHRWRGRDRQRRVKS
jgi:mevalonate kinase